MTSQSGLSTVEAAFEIIETLRDREVVGVSELAAELDMSKSTVHRHLSTMESTGHVVREGDQYRLGLKFLRLGEHTKNAREAYILAKPIVEELAEETGEQAIFATEEHGMAVYIQREMGEHAVRTNPRIGKRNPMHSISAGKAMLAEMPRSRVGEIIDEHGLPVVTENTITDRERLFEELDDIRQRGYSYNKQENIEGLRGVGVAVTGPRDEVIGSLTLAGPTQRMQGDLFEEEIPGLMLGAANELELNITYS